VKGGFSILYKTQRLDFPWDFNTVYFWAETRRCLAKMNPISYYHKRIVMKSDSTVDITVTEIMQSRFGCYIWPSAIILTNFLVEYLSKTKYACVLELGCGIGICGLVLNAKFKVMTILSDYDDFIIENLAQNILQNQSVLRNCSAKKLDWDIESDILSTIPEKTLVIGADLFYNPKSFEGLVQTISVILHNSAKNSCIIAYQERSSKRSLTPLLRKFNLRGTQIFPIYEDINDNFLFYEGSEEMGAKRFVNDESNSIYLFQIYTLPHD
jgi:methyltransferase-like protein 23